MNFNIDGKAITVDTSFIEAVDASKLEGREEVDRLAEEAVIEAFRREGVEFDKSISEHREALKDVSFYLHMIVNQIKKEKEKV